MVCWALPLLFFLPLCLYLAHVGDYQTNWLFDFITAARGWDKAWGRETFERTLPILSVTIMVLMAYPVTLLIFWGSTAAAKISHLYGLTIILIGSAGLLTWLAFNHWRNNGFRFTGVQRIGFTTSFILVIVFQLWVVFSTKFDFVGISAVFLAFSMLPVTSLVFRLSQGETKNFESYQYTASFLTEGWLHGELGPEQLDPLEGKELKSGKHRLGSVKEGEAVDVNDLTVTVGGDADLKTGDQKMRDAETADKDKAGEEKNADEEKTDGKRTGDGNEKKKKSKKRQQHEWNVWNLMLITVWFWILIAYGIVTIALADNRTIGAVGFITAAAVSAVDLTLLAAVGASKFKHPFAVILAMIIARILLAIFGIDLYFIGHAIVFTLIAIKFGYSAVNTLFPPEARRSSVMEILDKLGYTRGTPEYKELERKHVAQATRLEMFSKTPWGEWAVRNVDTVCLVVLVILFALDIALAATVAGSTFSVLNGPEYAQWVVGIIALFFTTYVVTTYATWRLFSNNAHVLTMVVIIVVLLKNACLGAAGIIIYAISGSVFTMNVFIFVPWVVDIGVAFFVKWVNNDYAFLQPAYMRSPPYAPLTYAIWNGALEHQDYVINGLGVLEIFVVGQFGLVVGVTDPVEFLGFAIPLGIYSLAFMLLPMVQWFNTLETTQFMWVMVAIAFFMHSLLCILLYTQALNSVNDLRALGLLFYYFMFPCIAALVFAAYKFKDDAAISNEDKTMNEDQRQQALSKRQGEEPESIDPWPYVLGATAITFYIFLIVATVFFFSVLVGLTLIGLYTLSLFAYTPRETVKQVLGERTTSCLDRWCYSLSDKTKTFAMSNDSYIYLVVIVIAIAFTVGVGLETDDGFLALSFAWGFIFIVLLVSTYRDFKDDFKTKRLTYLSSGNVFPVFSVREDSQLEPDNERVYNIYIECIMAFLWGVVAIYMFEGWIGLGVSSLAMTSAYAITINFKRRAQVKFKDAHDYLKEILEEKDYVQVIRTAQVAAYKAHVSDQRRPVLEKKKSTFGNILRKIKKTIQSRRESTASRTSISSTDMGNSPHQSHISDIKEIDPKVETAQMAGNKSPGSPPSSSSFFFRAETAIYSPEDQEFDARLKDEGIATWQDARNAKRKLLDKIPPINFMMLCHKPPSVESSGTDTDKNAESGLIEWELPQKTLHLTRTDAVRRAIRYHAYEIRRFLLYTRFVAQSIVNIISRADGERETNKALALNMLAEKGIAMKEDDYLNLDPTSIEYTAIRESFVKYLRDRRIKQAESNKEDITIDDPEIHRRMMEEAKRKEELEKKRLEEELNRERKADEEYENKLERAAEERKRLEEAEKERQRREAALIAAAATAAEKERVRLEEQRRQQELKRQQEELMRKKEALQAQKRKRQLAKERKIAEQMRKLPNQYLKLPDWKESEEDIVKDPTPSVLREWKGGMDPLFGPAVENGARALFINPKKPKHRNWKRYKWVKLTQDMRRRGLEPKLFEDEIEPADIRQGALGDCWFLSAIAVLSQHRKRLESIFLSHTDNQGVYSLRFYKNNEVRVVTVDDCFPVDPRGRPVFARSHEPSEMWVMILEKAYAKLHTCYEAIEAGFVDQALVDMTNGISTRFDMTKENIKVKIDNGVLWKTLVEYHRQGFLMGAGTPAGSDSEANASYWGIVQGHAYSILDLFTIDVGVNLIQLRNPWGRKEWTGDWSDNSDKWTRRYRALVERRQKKKFVAADDGAFWMEFRDFSIHFEDIYVCRFFEPERGWFAKQTYYGKWDKTNDGGCTNFVTVSQSPQFLLTVHETTIVVLNLAQEEDRGQFDDNGQPIKKAAIAVEIYQNKGNYVTRTRSGKKLKSNPRSYCYTREVTCQATLPVYKRKGEVTPFTVLISTFHPKVHKKYTLRVFSNKPITFEALPPKPKSKPRR
mmetsp:Transcript_13890/g.26293  ORF Transcript_13890/g.26293 Transcript_13890/m.26293 type:complete len:1904 (+) Transcript_13890:1-5712(+)